MVEWWHGDEKEDEDESDEPVDGQTHPTKMGFGGLLAQGRPRKKSGSERRTRFGLGVTGQRLFLLGCRGKSPDGPGGFGRANEGVCGADEDRAGSRQRARSQRARAGGSHRHGAATEPGAHVAAERQRGGETRSSIRLVDQNSGATTVLSLSDVIASSGALPFRDVMIDPGEFVPEHTPGRKRGRCKGEYASESPRGGEPQCTQRLAQGA